MSQRYLFVDGGHLRLHYRDHMRAFFGSLPPPLDYEALVVEARCTKLFFYDSVDRRADQAAVAEADAELARIHRTPNCHVRQGTVRRGKKRRGRQQKQVDVLLAVEMLTHGFRRNFDDAVLLSGDLDFKPAVDNLVNLGLRIEVWYARRTAAAALLDAADARRELTLRDFFRWSGEAFMERHRGEMPEDTWIDHKLPYPVVAKGRIGDLPCTLLAPGDSRPVLTIAGLHRRNDRRITALDRERLERYVSLVYGAITWS